MADDIQTTTASLSDLNKVTRDTSFEFKGLSQSLLNAAASVDGAGKTWTNFSRMLSGTALWKLQNYFRGIIGFIATQQIGLNKSIQAAKEQEEQRRRTIVDMKKIKTLYSELDSNMTVFNMARDFSAFTENQKDAIEGTVAYADALALGLTEFEAYNRGFHEITQGFANQTDNYNDLVGQMQFAENLKSQAGRKDEYVKMQNQRLGMSPLNDMVNDMFRLGQVIDKGVMGAVGVLSKVTPRNAIALGQRGLSATKDVLKDPQKLMLGLERKLDKIGQTKLALKYQKGMLSLKEKLTPFLNVGMKFLVIGLFAMIGLIMFMGAIQNIMEEMAVLNVLTQLNEIAGIVVESINLLVEFVGHFLNNDFESAINTLSDFATVAFDLLGKVILAGLSIAVGVIIGLVKGLPKILFSEQYRGVALNILTKFLGIYMVAYFTRYMAIKLMEIAAIYALPVLIGVVVGLAILAGLQKLFPKTFGRRATGGLVNENVTLVGESGPELVSLPTGSKVHTNNQTRNMMGGSRNVFNITINARDTSDAELRRIADKIGQLVSRSVNRSTSSRTLR